MSASPARALMTCVVLAMSGCAGTNDADDSLGPAKGKGTKPPTEAKESEVVAAVSGAALTASAPGTQVWNFDGSYTPSGAVEILTTSGGSTGVLIGASMVLTSGHTWYDGTDSGYVGAKIHLALPDGRWRCLSGPDEEWDGKCSYHERVSFERYDAEPEQPSVGRDLMALFPEQYGGQWAGGVAHLAAQGVFTGQLGDPIGVVESVTLFGRGFTDQSGAGRGVMRSATFLANYVVPADATSIKYEAFRNGGALPCGGDSGGPLDLGFSWVAGLHSGRHPQTGQRCGTSDQTLHATKFTYNKMQWLNGRRRYNGLDDCWGNEAGYWWCH